MDEKIDWLDEESAIFGRLCAAATVEFFIENYKGKQLEKFLRLWIDTQKNKVDICDWLALKAAQMQACTNNMLGKSK